MVQPNEHAFLGRARAASTRRGFTLPEVMVVLALLGAIAIFATSMQNSSNVLRNLEARQEAQVLSKTFRLARYTAISTNTPIRVRTLRRGRLITGVEMLSTTTGEKLVADQLFPIQLDVTSSRRSVVFQPTGMTNRGITVRIAGQRSEWTLDVVQATGQVITSQRRN